VDGGIHGFWVGFAVMISGCEAPAALSAVPASQAAIMTANRPPSSTNTCAGRDAEPSEVD
jgi:hypothetical protein